MIVTRPAQVCPALESLDVSGWKLRSDGPIVEALLDIVTDVRARACALHAAAA